MTAARLRVYDPGNLQPPTPSRPTINDVIDRYWSHATANERFSERAHADRDALFNDLCDALGDKFVDECCGNDLQTWIGAHKGWKSSSTKRSKANWVKAAFNWAALEAGLIKANPFRLVSYEEGDPREPVDDADFWAIYKLADRGFRWLMLFLRISGCRVGEASALTWGMVDFKKGIATLQKHKTRKKTKKPRLMFLTKEALKLLRYMGRKAKDAGRDDFIFTNQLGNPWTKSTLDTKWSRLRKKAKVTDKAMIHGIRHAFGTRKCSRPGANIKLVSLAMGHSSVTTTEKFYCHLNDKIEAIRAELEN